MSERAHITVIETVYHQRTNGDPIAIETRFSRPLHSNNQIYQRELEITEEWQVIDRGWIEKVGLVIISNEEGKHLQTQPTKEARRDYASRKLELGIQEHEFLIPFAIVLPGESLRICPIGAIRIRCMSGSAKAKLSVIPL